MGSGRCNPNDRIPRRRPFCSQTPEQPAKIPPVNPFEAELDRRLAGLQQEGLHRQLRRIDSAQSPRLQTAESTLLNFASNDYLGLANHPALKLAAIHAVESFGAGSGASRLLCGSLAPFHQLEESLASFKGTEAALTFSSGYTAALGSITAITGKNDILILDKLVHACIVDAARLSGARLRIFAHNDPADLEDKLRWARQQQARAANTRILVITESVFSMDGDTAPLREIIALKDKYGAWLMVDEAHATGLYGERRRGLAEELGVSGGIELQMGTLGKALGAGGGFVCGSRRLVDFLVNRARSFIFSTAPVPAAAAAATEAIAIVQSGQGADLRRRLFERIGQFRSDLGLSTPVYLGAILPLIIGDETKALAAAHRLREAGFLAPAIRYPSVARGAARLRITLTAGHTATEVGQLCAALRALGLNGYSIP
jgi:8-amino-7-oxononanoate synthase